MDQGLDAITDHRGNVSNGYRDAYIKWLVTAAQRQAVDGSNRLRSQSDHSGATVYQPRLVGTHRSRLCLKTVAIRRPQGQVLDPRIKSINYLNLVLAKLEAKAAGADEALMLDAHGRVCEATGCNVFVVRGRHLRTPRHDILAGITRETVFEIASERGLGTEETDLELYDAYTADEIFICGTAGGLLPITSIDGRQIASGRPGPVFKELHAAYQALIASDRHGTPVFS